MSREQRERPFSAWSAIRSALSLAIDAYTSSMQYEACSARLDDIARQCDELIAENTRAQLAAAEQRASYEADVAAQAIAAKEVAERERDALNAEYAQSMEQMQAVVNELRTHVERAEADSKRLRESAITALNYMVGAAVACNGMKCRELNCESCCAEDDVNTFVQKAHNAYDDLRDAIGTATARDGQGA